MTRTYLAISNKFWNMTKSKKGASLVEYAILVALIGVVCIGAVQFLGNATSNKLNSAAYALNNNSH